MDRLRIVFLGLSITSSWGNGHATTYRGLVRELVARGHQVSFLERDMPWYAAHRDLPEPPHGTTCLYRSRAELEGRFGPLIAAADVVVLGSYVPEGVAVGRWLAGITSGILAFYDIDTPVTLAKLARGDHEYLAPDLIPAFDLYLSFTGGPLLERLERVHGARMARPLYCAVDPALYYPEPVGLHWDLGYLGTYSDDRQPVLDALLVAPARALPAARFVVAGPQYPAALDWPANVARIEHLPPDAHRAFYNAQRFTLNITRADMVRAGFSPSVRLFEAAACGTPIISDWWEGLDSLFTPGVDIVIARGPEDVTAALRDLDHDAAAALGRSARARVLAAHTAAHRAAEFEAHVRAALGRRGLRAPRRRSDSALFG